MGLSSFNAMRARERAKLQAQAEVEKPIVEEKSVVNENLTTEPELKVDDDLLELKKQAEKKKTDAEKLKKKGM